MKKLTLMLLLAIVFFTGCAGMQYEDSKVCPPPNEEDSWICEKSEDLNIAPEGVYYLIFDAAAIAVITDVTDIAWLWEFDSKIATWYIDLYPNVTPADLINKIIKEMKLIEDPGKLLLISSVINRHLRQFWSVELINEYDDGLVRGGNNWFRNDLGCDPL